MRFVRVIFSVLLFAGSFSGLSQSNLYTDSRFRAGIVLSLGTHETRAGFCFNVYYIAGAVQFNTEARTYWNWRNLGPPLRYSELVISQAVICGFGAGDQPLNPFPGLLTHQTGKPYSIGYAYNAWFNRVGTTQQTGAIMFSAYNWTFINENDIYARPALDRFRTGGVMIRYRHDQLLETGLLCKVWTGQYKKKQPVDSIPQFRNNCYMDTTGGMFTRYSHGILAAETRLLLPYSQVVRAAAGVDSERIRNGVQNNFLHNMRFVPQKWLKRKNCHLPMVDEDGDPYLYRPGQTVRKPRPYLQLSGNPGIFF